MFAHFGRRIFQPLRICRMSSSDLYWVRIKIRRSPELIQLDKVKSIIRYAPPKGTAGLAVSRVRG